MAKPSRVALTILVVAFMLGGVWIGYATDDEANIWVAIGLSAMFVASAIALIPHGIEMGLRLRRELFGPEPNEGRGELGEDR